MQTECSVSRDGCSDVSDNQNYNVSDGSNSSSEMTKQTAVISTFTNYTDSSTQRRRPLLICNLESREGGQAFTSTLARSCKLCSRRDEIEDFNIIVYFLSTI